MSFFTRLKSSGNAIKAELHFYQLLLKDRRVPKPAKWLIVLAIGYALSPIDFIPDFIPVLGYLDDIVIVPALIFLAMKIIPLAVIDDCRGHFRTPP